MFMSTLIYKWVGYKKNVRCTGVGDNILFYNIKTYTQNEMFELGTLKLIRAMPLSIIYMY